MKKMLLSLMMLIGVPAMAGDHYFVCSHIVDPATQEEEFVVDQYVNRDDESVVHAVFQVRSEPKLLYTVHYDHATQVFSASVKSFRSVSKLDQITTELEFGHPVQLSPRLSCFISD